MDAANDAVVSAWPNELAAITLFVEDLSATKAFYMTVFGLPALYELSDSVVFKVGVTMLNFLVIANADELVAPAKVADGNAGSRFVFTVEVPDVDQMCAELATHGVTLLNGPMDRPWGIRTASFCDPDGYIWEIAK